jgi:superfamily II DNA or RNA helicase
MKTESIEMCLLEDSSKWEQTAAQFTSFEESKETSMTAEQVSSFYDDETRGLNDVVPLDEMMNISKEMSIEVDDYRHSNFQAAIAGIAASQKSPFSIVVSPTGSGKTWI